jgi:8-oxo-dGTP pyrophosphatase MutT (NUDIX family)
MPKYEDLPYRPCAGLCVINRKGLVFIGRRIDGPEHVDRTHVWQMPQGGIDDGEKPYPAALRELYEETNIKSVQKRKTYERVAQAFSKFAGAGSKKKRKVSAKPKRRPALRKKK